MFFMYCSYRPHEINRNEHINIAQWFFKHSICWTRKFVSVILGGVVYLFGIRRRSIYRWIDIKFTIIALALALALVLALAFTNSKNTLLQHQVGSFHCSFCSQQNSDILKPYFECKYPEHQPICYDVSVHVTKSTVWRCRI